MTLDMLPQLMSGAGGVQTSILPTGLAVSESSTSEGRAGSSSTGDGSIKPLWKIEGEHIKRALDACDGNVSRAAAMLEIGTSTLYRRLKEIDGDE